MNALITKEYQGTPFVFREDGYFSMSKTAQAFGKDLSNFWKSPGIFDYCSELSRHLDFKSVESTDLSYGLAETRRGNGGGTWAHWCDAIIEDILTKKADLTITKPAESATVAATHAGMGLDLAATLAQSILAAVSSVKQIENRVETLEKNVEFSSELVTYEADWLCDTCELSVDRRY